MSSQTYLEQKWRRAFNYMDVDCDDFMSAADLCAPAIYIQRVFGLKKENTKSFRKSWVRWFYYFQDDSFLQNIDEDKWVALLKGEYETNLELAKAFSCTSYGELFDILDRNKDGKLSLDELEIYYRSHNVTDEGFVKKVFDKLDLDGDGYIQRDEFVKAAENYWWNPDPEEGYGFMYDRPEMTLKN